MNINDITKQIRAFADQLETQSLEQTKPDPYAELKKAHAAGKVIQGCIRGHWIDCPHPTWKYPVNTYREKPEKLDVCVVPQIIKNTPFQPPPPPLGMQWHRTDMWKEGDLPQGWRPLVLNEESKANDEHWACGIGPWKALEYGGQRYDKHNTKCRTRRPLTFTHEGKQWTWHRPGDPMPCDGTKRVIPLVFYEGKYSTGGNMEGAYWNWNDEHLIGWSYADEKKTVPLGPEDVPPGSVLSLKPPRWFIISGVNDNGLYVLDDEPLVENLWKWDYLMEKAKINRSIPLTGKWNPDAWDPCHKEIDA